VTNTTDQRTGEPADQQTDELAAEPARQQTGRRARVLSEEPTSLEPERRSSKETSAHANQAPVSLAGDNGHARHAASFLARHWPLLVILATFVALALAYSLATPVGESPDEPTHVEYVLYLLREHSLPVLPIEEEGLAQAKHPPLYYMAAAAVSAWADMSSLGFVANPHFTFNMEAPGSPSAFVHYPFENYPYQGGEGFLAVRLMRLISLLCGVVVVAATYALGRTVWPERRYLQWGPAAAVAFLPGFLFMSGVVNNDTMANAFSALVLLGATRVALGHASRRDLFLLGLALGLGLLSKLTMIAAVAVAGMGVLIHAYRARDARWLLTAAGWVGGPVVATFGLWVVRNMVTYGPADPLGWGRWQAKIPQMARSIPLSSEIQAYFWTQLTTFWGRFGWATISLPGAVYRVLLLVMGLALLGLIVLVAADWRRLEPDTRWALALVGTSVILLYASVFRLAFTFNLVVAHGRYVYIALAGLGLLFVTGLTRWLPRSWRPAGALVIAAALLALSLVSLTKYIVPAFAAPAPVAPEELEHIQHPTDAVFGGKLSLVGYDLSAERIDPGRTITATLYWSATDANFEPFPPSPAGHTAFAHLVDSSGEVVARVDEDPFGGSFPTGAWQPGLVWRMQHVLHTSPDAAPGEAKLLVGWHIVDQPFNRLPVMVDGEIVGDSLPLGPIVIRQAQLAPQATEGGEARGDRFGTDGQITLLRAQVTPGNPVEVTLHWRAEKPMDHDYTVFVHAIDADGNVVATGDGPPQDGRYRTSLWEPGEIVVDTHQVALEPGAVVRFTVGLYDLETGKRLPAVSTTGKRWPDDAVPLGSGAGMSDSD
jgi:hypothetical protein